MDADEFADEMFLKFNLKGLSAAAASKDQEVRHWLSRFLVRCPDTVEARRLEALLTSPR
jgi:hypothetical protein